MGVSTHGFLNKDITAKQIYNVIVTKFDKDAEFDVRYDKNFKEEVGNIYFKDEENKRDIFYCITRDKEEGTEFLNGKKHVCLVLGAWGRSVEIMTGIVKAFGGYIDENDCDDINAYYISKDENFKYNEYIEQRDSIINVLTKELNEKDKIKIANEILLHKEELKKIL